MLTLKHGLCEGTIVLLGQTETELGLPSSCPRLAIRLLLYSRSVIEIFRAFIFSIFSQSGTGAVTLLILD